ncbi:hypothetical protein DSCA_47210 [Desulfosarcina alkanivorans]|jgi:uncharacterized protein YkwD|uniref:SCP domain-containing protein n=1 Tax=Desulfosarcina alkanivorans TaxID=571177 RepID=A0A5K7YUT0_9BACT|nr:CAP domain-containing protein [Desulfosarcina alkanivorans]BBO70791.1 hypothetical protein DSCA_47210 [Desulfosarcina alkanivorans]
MKKKLVCILLPVLLISLPIVVPAGDADLFVDSTIPIPFAWETANPTIVARQRPVRIQFEKLAPDQYGSLSLNFFEDVGVTVMLDRVEADGADGFAWMGSVASGGSGTATLVLQDNRLTGTVQLENLAYQVRHIEGDLHLVREILTPQIEFRAMTALAGSSSEEEEVLAGVNLERQIYNLGPLQWDSSLHAAALGHSEDMARNDYFSHTSLDGRSAGQRITQAGYSLYTYGENIAAGYSTPAAVVEGWMNSAGHRANILSSSFCDIGVGLAYSAASRYGYYWTQDFGRRQGVVACDAVQRYSISAVAGPHGRISPSGIVTVESGARAVFTIVADPGYRIADVLVDGQSAGPIENCTLDHIERDHTIEALFEKLPPARKGSTLPWLPLLLND